MPSSSGPIPSSIPAAGSRLTLSWHIDALCWRLQQMVEGRVEPQLVINAPPRSLKSFIVSVALPAWCLARRPAIAILCASYGEDLARGFSRATRAILESPNFRRLFTETRLNPAKATESEFETTRRGYRLATSVGGPLTGRGGDLLIVDDPIKAADASSETARAAVDAWFNGTFLTRRNRPDKAIVVVVMQRLHEADLAGRLIEAGWPSLVFPAVATEPAVHATDDTEHLTVAPGDLLQAGFLGQEVLDKVRRDIGERAFMAQYQQAPLPAEGNLVKGAHLGRYGTVPDRSSLRRIVIGVDMAAKMGERNDHTAMVVLGRAEEQIHVLEVVRAQCGVTEARDRVLGLAARWDADAVVVEDIGVGTSLIELLKQADRRLPVLLRVPKGSKEERLQRHLGTIEAGHLLLPEIAPWLGPFEHELLAFPNGKHDDQVDALVLGLDWLRDNARARIPTGFRIGMVSREAYWQV